MDESVEPTNPAEFPEGFPFLLNFRDGQIRYYRRKEKQTRAARVVPA